MTPKFSAEAQNFIDSVLRLQPRFAAFDCDGTLWSGDAGEGFFRWAFAHRLVSDKIIREETARHDEYLAGRVSEDEMCERMATLHEGLAESEVEKAAAAFFAEKIEPNIFPEMRELVRLLDESGCEIWAVSSTNEWVIREGMKRFAIPSNRILAARVQVENGTVVNKLIYLPSGDGKSRLIQEIVKKRPDAAFGNSRWDEAMLSISKNAFAINPNPDLEKVAQARNWTVYWPDSVRK